MDLYEFQAKQLFAASGVPVGLGEVAATPGEARAAAGRIGGTVVIKAQVKVGGRGKAGGVKVARTPDDAAEVAAQILGMDIKGHTVHRVLVDPASDIEPRSTTSRSCSTARTARSWPWRPTRAAWRSSSWPRSAPRRWVGSRSTRWPAWTRPRPARSWPPVKFPADDVADQVVADACSRLWETFVATDATLVEVNPLAKVNRPDGGSTVLALERQGDAG